MGIAGTTRECVECGGEFAQKACRPMRFCSGKCRKRFDRSERARARRIAAYGSDSPTKKCIQCEAEFRPGLQGFNQALFCSDRCRGRYRAQTNINDTCDVCGEKKPDHVRADSATCGKTKCRRENHNSQCRVRRHRENGTLLEAHRMDFDNIMRSWLRRKKIAEERGEDFDEPRPERRSDEAPLPKSWRERHEFEAEDD
jgi:hypothetical protein